MDGDVGKRKVAATMDQPLASAMPPFISTLDANMTKCYEQWRQFFTICGTFHLNQLIAYWMMVGYLGPVGSVEEACQKGQHMLDDFIQEGMLRPILKGDRDMIEFVKAGEHFTSTKVTDIIQCKQRGFHVHERFGFFDLLDWHLITDIILTDGMLKQRKVTNSCFQRTDSYDKPREGGKCRYLAHFNPTIDSVKPLFEIHTHLYLLILRGCGGLLPQTTLPLEISHTLTVLEISGSTHLTTINLDTISHLKHLVYLNLSDLLIQSLPDGFFKRHLRIQWLILRGCSKLCSLSEPPINVRVLDLSHCIALQEIDVDLSEAGEMSPTDDTYANLEVLDLSRTQIEYVRLTNSRLRCMLLRECTSLKELPAMGSMENLEVLDVSGCDKLLQLPGDLSHLMELKELNLFGCSGLGYLTEGLFDQMSSLLKLDLSGTNVKALPSFVSLTSLCKLSLRGLKLHSLEPLTCLSSLVELDLKGLEISPPYELRLDFLQSFEHLQILNLSETLVAQLPDLSKLVSLKELLLADCRHLKVVPDLQTLTNLENLDLSLLDDSTINSCQLEIKSDPQNGIPLSAPSSLRKLVLTNRSGLQNLFSLTSLGSLEFLDLRGTDVRSIPQHYMEQIKCIHLPTEIYLSEVYSSDIGNLQEATDRDINLHGGVSKPVEIHIVSATGNSFNPESRGASSSYQPSVLEQFKDEYIKLDALFSEMQEKFKSSMVTGTTASVATNEDAFAPSVGALTFKLQKLLSDLKYILENFRWLTQIRNYRNQEIGAKLLKELTDAITHLSTDDFLDDSSYLMQLLRIVIKVKILVTPTEVLLPKASGVTRTKKEKETLWLKRSKNKKNDADIVKDSSSHEFQDLLSSYDCLNILQKCCLLCFSVFPLDKDNDKNEGVLKSLVIKKRMLIYLWVGEGFLDYPSADMSIKKVEEARKDVLTVLADKGFIEHVMKKGLESGSCCMRPFVHEFVTAKAKEEGFFDFNQKNGKLTPHFRRSQRACLLKTQENSPSSCNLWANYDYYRKNQERLKNVRTLFNVTESVVDIKPELFSKMKSLRVLHLGSWRSDHEDHIEVYDIKFLEELANMKIMRLLSLQGMSTIIKLPDSVCKLTNLIILDLRECTDLEELPADIGSLKSLTHLDLTNCRRLTELPKGIRLLSKLEVLKGFVITKQDCGPQTTKVCVLKDLLNLKKLRKLNIVVKINIFPDDKELQVLKDMDSLCKLKITWEKDFNFTDEEWFLPQAHNAIIDQEVMRPSKWKKLICWECQSSQDDREETSRNEHLTNIEKLELWCYPFEIAPYWLNPSELKSLKKLYIGGGNLTKLHCGTDQNKWNVTTLHLKYLHNLGMRWSDLKNMFPNLTYLEKHQCPKLPIFHCDEEGVWMHERKESTNVCDVHQMPMTSAMNLEDKPYDEEDDNEEGDP